MTEARNGSAAIGERIEAFLAAIDEPQYGQEQEPRDTEPDRGQKAEIECVSQDAQRQEHHAVREQRHGRRQMRHRLRRA